VLLLGLPLRRWRRFSSRSMAMRIRSTRASPGSSASSIRAVVPSARGSVSRSFHLFLRPIWGGVAYVRESGKAILFVGTKRGAITYVRYALNARGRRFVPMARENRRLAHRDKSSWERGVNQRFRQARLGKVPNMWRFVALCRTLVRSSCTKGQWLTLYHMPNMKSQFIRAFRIVCPLANRGELS
jgi:hypothetical protein